jgi:predicted transcriptional regulator
MEINITVSKSYANEVVSDYKEIVDQIDSIIKQTGYKGKYIAKKLGLPESTFYQKKRNKSFTHEEMGQIISLLEEEEDDDDAIENEFFIKLFKEREHDEIVPNGFETLKKIRNARRS